MAGKRPGCLNLKHILKSCLDPKSFKTLGLQQAQMEGGARLKGGMGRGEGEKW